MALPSHTHTPDYCSRFIYLTIILSACLHLFALPALAKTFPVEAFGQYVSEYDQDLARQSKTVTKTEAEIKADIALAETADNARLAAASLEQLLTQHPADGGRLDDLRPRADDGKDLHDHLWSARFRYAPRIHASMHRS